MSLCIQNQFDDMEYGYSIKPQINNEVSNEVRKGEASYQQSDRWP